MEGAEGGVLLEVFTASSSETDFPSLPAILRISTLHYHKRYCSDRIEKPVCECSSSAKSERPSMIANIVSANTLQDAHSRNCYLKNSFAFRVYVQGLHIRIHVYA